MVVFALIPGSRSVDFTAGPRNTATTVAPSSSTGSADCRSQVRRLCAVQQGYFECDSAAVWVYILLPVCIRLRGKGGKMSSDIFTCTGMAVKENSRLVAWYVHMNSERRHLRGDG